MPDVLQRTATGADWVPASAQAWPVGSVFIAVVSTNPATLLGYGTWSAFGAGRVLVSLDAGQAEFDTVEETGGAKTHTLATGELPSHDHGGVTTSRVLKWRTDDAGAGGQIGLIDLGALTGAAGGSTANFDLGINAQGGGSAHNNLQPYIVVYMWKRTA
jgi:microcystin-dependent protein